VDDHGAALMADPSDKPANVNAQLNDQLNRLRPPAVPPSLPSLAPGLGTTPVNLRWRFDSLPGPINPSVPYPGVSIGHSASTQRLHDELEASQEEVRVLQEMLEDLTEIFERKFRQRLEGVLAQHRKLLADNIELHQRLYALGGHGATAPERQPLLLPSTTPQPPSRWRSLKSGLRQALERGRNRLSRGVGASPTVDSADPTHR
jgi:hypothetical protein